MSNAPDRHEKFVVPDGVRKVTYERDTKISDAAMFILQREDHTLGNLIRMQLHRDPNILFAGYKLPHPLKYEMHLRIQTTSQSSPAQAYNQALTDLENELTFIKEAFQDAVRRRLDQQEQPAYY